MISKEQKIAEVPASEKGSRFDQVTAILFPEFSRSCLTQWIRDGFITLDGHVNPPKYKVKGGEQLKLEVEINERVEIYKTKWKGITLTPTALLKHWSKLGQMYEENKPPKKHDCVESGHKWIDLDVIFHCQVCKEEKTK